MVRLGFGGYSGSFYFRCDQLDFTPSFASDGTRTVARIRVGRLEPHRPAEQAVAGFGTLFADHLLGSSLAFDGFV